MENEIEAKKRSQTGDFLPSGAASCSAVVATIEWIRGNRTVSTVMRNAGLGLVGAGIKERVKISYKPGEIVTEERVMKAVQSMIEQSNAMKTDFEICCPRLICIRQPNVQEHPTPLARASVERGVKVGVTKKHGEENG